MTVKAATCPCCKQPFAPSGVVVDLNTNSLVFRGRTTKLTARLAELASILARRMPGVVEHSQIHSELWGVVASESVQAGVQVAVNQLRKRLPRDLVVHSHHSRGYSMDVVRASQMLKSETQPENRTHA